MFGSMEQKHLQQLLNEQQEPFFLENFINERRYLRRRSHPGKQNCSIPNSRSRSKVTAVPIKRTKSSRKGVNSAFSGRYSESSGTCSKQTCFPFHDPTMKSLNLKSRCLNNFTSPATPPCTNLQVESPSRTAALLLEGALRILDSKPLSIYSFSPSSNQLCPTLSTIRHLLEMELANNNDHKQPSPATTTPTLSRATEALIHSFRRSLSIKKHSSSPNPKTQDLSIQKTSSYSLFRSIIKKIMPAKNSSMSTRFLIIRSFNKQNRKPENGGSYNSKIKVKVKDILSWDQFETPQPFDSDQSSVFRHETPQEKYGRKILEEKKPLGENQVSGMGFSCSGNSNAWSESDETRSVDLETASSRSDDYGELEPVEGCRGELHEQRSSSRSPSCEFLSVQVSPTVDIAKETCSNGGHSVRACCWQPEYQSTAASPCRPETVVGGQTFPHPSNGSCGSAGEEYKEKGQFSPVSVLDLDPHPPFGDDAFEQSFATVQRAKQQLLHKLCRFERLAELADPLELERWIAEDEEEDESEIAEKFAREILNRSRSSHCSWRLPPGMKRLVEDLIKEEEEKADAELNPEHLAKKIGRIIGDWKSVESNTIDTTVELDFGRGAYQWKAYSDQVKETAIEIEIAIFCCLLEELSFDFSCSYL